MAGLVSESQVEVALHDQHYNHHMLLGEILVLRGWVKSSTVEFFVEHFHRRPCSSGLPLGECLKQADLLTDNQIQEVLKEQNHSWIKFGAAAVLRGFIKQETLDFFKEYFFPTEEKRSDYRQKQQSRSSKAKLDNVSALESALTAYFANNDRYDSDNIDNSGELDITEFKWI
ncbi:MAG: hypothetical protein HC796_02895 [Synechococcaceae cyanobacterium RL_1_2]|nr:hypothetical protein [Synechococcaceae cyanobacterium RL_1_2]